MRRIMLVIGIAIAFMVVGLLFGHQISEVFCGGMSLSARERFAAYLCVPLISAALGVGATIAGLKLYNRQSHSK